MFWKFCLADLLNSLVSCSFFIDSSRFSRYMTIASVDKDSFIPSSPTQMPFLSLAWLYRQEPKYRLTRSGENGNTPLFNLGGSIQSLTVKCVGFLQTALRVVEEIPFYSLCASGFYSGREAEFFSDASSVSVQIIVWFSFF